MFKKAERSRKKLRLAINGPSGAGKTFSMLAIAIELGKKIAVIDTEHGSSTLYAEYFEFDQCDLDQYHPNKYIEAIRFAGANGYDVIVIDSLSHAWLEMLNMVGGNFNNWAKVRPLERSLIDAILASPAHVLVSMRSKSDYVDGVQNGKNTKVKVGTKAVMADGIEYEFDIAAEIDLGHVLTISKSRCKPLQDTTWANPGKEFADQLKQWLEQGAESIEVKPKQVAKKQQPAPAQQAKPLNARSQIAATFKAHYTDLGVSRDKAIEFMHSIDANAQHPADLQPDELKECLNLISQEAKKMQALADQTAAYSKADLAIAAASSSVVNDATNPLTPEQLAQKADYERMIADEDEMLTGSRAESSTVSQFDTELTSKHLPPDDDDEGSVNWMHK